MNSQSADAPFYQGFSHFWLGSLQGIEGTAVVLDLDLDTRISPRKAHGNFVLETVVVSIRDHVGDNFFQHEIYAKDQLGSEIMLRCKLSHDLVQPFDF